MAAGDDFLLSWASGCDLGLPTSGGGLGGVCEGCRARFSPVFWAWLSGKSGSRSPSKVVKERSSSPHPGFFS